MREPWPRPRNDSSGCIPRAGYVSCVDDGERRTSRGGTGAIERERCACRFRTFVAARARPAVAGRGRGVVGTRGAAWPRQRPSGAAAVGHFPDLRRSRPHRRARTACRRDAVAGDRRVRLRRRRGHRARRDHRLFRADEPAGGSDPAGAARDSLDRLGAAVHSLVRHLRGLEDHPDRRGRVLSGLSRRHGRGDVGRSQDRRGRPRLPVVGDRHGAPHPAAGGDAGLCHLAARGHGTRLDVRGRGGIHGRFRPASASCSSTASNSASRPRSSRRLWPLRSSARRPTG